MANQRLLQLLESVLGKGKSTSGDNVAFFSPFKSHYKPKLEINLKTDSKGDNPWHCWISDQKGRSIHSLFKQLNLPRERFEELERIIKFSKFRNTDTAERKEILQLPAEYRPLWVTKNTPDYRNAISYLKSRNVSIFDIIRYRIGYCEDGAYSGKIIIPSYDANGQLNYFVSRAFYQADWQKHKNPRVSKDIIGFEMMINWNEPVVLCEGAFDAIAIKRNALPLFGKIIQPALRKKLIEKRVRDIYICLDSDAIRNALDIADTFMKEGLNVYFVALQDQDASELGFEEITKRIAETDKLTFQSMINYQMGILWK
jgi:DNA primase